jgi:hypothetical protein
VRSAVWIAPGHRSLCIRVIGVFAIRTVGSIALVVP